MNPKYTQQWSLLHFTIARICSKLDFKSIYLNNLYVQEVLLEIETSLKGVKKSHRAALAEVVVRVFAVESKVVLIQHREVIQW